MNLHPDDIIDNRNNPDALHQQPLVPILRWCAVGAVMWWIFTARAAHDVAGFIQWVAG